MNYTLIAYQGVFFVEDTIQLGELMFWKVMKLWKQMQCLAVFTEDINKSITFYEALGLTKAWDTFQDEAKQWRLVGMKFPNGETELVLKNNPNFAFAETEIVVEDVQEIYSSLSV